MQVESWECGESQHLTCLEGFHINCPSVHIEIKNEKLSIKVKVMKVKVMGLSNKPDISVCVSVHLENMMKCIYVRHVMSEIISFVHLSICLSICPNVFATVMILLNE